MIEDSLADQLRRVVGNGSIRVETRSHVTPRVAQLLKKAKHNLEEAVSVSGELTLAERFDPELTRLSGELNDVMERVRFRAFVEPEARPEFIIKSLSRASTALDLVRDHAMKMARGEIKEIKPARARKIASEINGLVGSLQDSVLYLHRLAEKIPGPQMATRKLAKIGKVLGAM